MFLAVVVLTGGMHVLASNSASVKADKSAIEQEMANEELEITGNENIEYDGAAVKLDNENGDFQYMGDGMPVWYKLNDDGEEKGELSENYTRVRNYPKDAGKYAVTVYNQKIEEHSKPFYFQIKKAPLKLLWPDQVVKIYNNDPYFDMRLKYMGGLVGDDGNNPNIEFRVRVVADGKSEGIHKVVDIERFANGVDMSNYQFQENAPTEVEILSRQSMFPDDTVAPGGISEVILPELESEETAGDLVMDETQQKYGEKAMRAVFNQIVKTTPLKDVDMDGYTASEQQTLKTEQNIAKAVKRGAYINMYVETAVLKNDDINQITDTLEPGAKMVKTMDIKISAKSIEQNELVCYLGELVNIDHKLTFTMELPDEEKGGQYTVARVVDGQVEYLPSANVRYDTDKNQVTFSADKGTTYAIVKLA